MYRIDGPGKVAVLPAPAAATGGGYFTELDETKGIPPTKVTADWLNGVQTELVEVVQQGGAALDKASNAQLAGVLQGAYGARAGFGSVSGDPSRNTMLMATLGCTAQSAGGSPAAVVASENSDAIGANVGVMASSGSEARGDECAVIASVDATVESVASAVVAANDSYVENNVLGEALVAASLRANIRGALTFAKVLMAAQDCEHYSSLAALVASKHTRLDKDLCVAGGYDPGGAPVIQEINQTWRIESRDSTGGANHGRAIFEGGTSVGPADYAELFENVEQGIIAPATLVTRRGRRVQPAGSGDRVLGVVSARPGVVGNSAPFEWGGRWQRDELGRPLLEDAEWVRSPGYDGPLEAAPQPVPAAAEHSTKRVKLVLEQPGEHGRARHVVEHRDVEWVSWPTYDGPLDAAPAALHPQAEYYTGKVQVQAEAYDAAAPYVPRDQRPDEWTCVGLLGQLPVRVDATVRPDDFVEAGAVGQGTRAPKDTRLECMELLSEYDEGRGYGVALCLVR